MSVLFLPSQTATIIIPAGLAACRSLESLTEFLFMGLPGQAVPEHQWLCTIQLRSGTTDAALDKAGRPLPDPHWPHVGPLGCVCITLPWACEIEDYLKLVRSLQLQQDRHQSCTIVLKCCPAENICLMGLLF